MWALDPNWANAGNFVAFWLRRLVQKWPDDPSWRSQGGDCWAVCSCDPAQRDFSPRTGSQFHQSSRMETEQISARLSHWLPKTYFTLDLPVDLGCVPVNSQLLLRCFLLKSLQISTWKVKFHYLRSLKMLLVYLSKRFTGCIISILTCRERSPLIFI